MLDFLRPAYAARTDLLFAGRVLTVQHDTLNDAHKYAWHALEHWKSVSSVDIRSPRGERDKLIVTVKRKGELT